MAAEQEIRNMSEDNIFDALMEQYGKAAGESISAMLKTKVEIKAPENQKHWLRMWNTAFWNRPCLSKAASLRMQPETLS